MTIQLLAQNTFPNNGNVGINTSSPSARLDVNGNMKVDSSLIVKDSVTVEKDMRTKGKFTVEDQAYFLKLVTMYEKLNVFGNIVGENNIRAINNLIAENNVNVGNNINVTNNANIDNKLNVSGDAKFDGNVKLMNLLGLNNLNNPNLEVILRTPSGNLRTFDLVELINIIVLQADKTTLENCTPEYVLDPYWMSKPEVLYTLCPNVSVGIGTSNPQHKLHNTSTTYSTRFLSGNATGPTNALINAFSQGGNQPLIQLGKKLTNNPEDVRFIIGHYGEIISTNTADQTSLTINNGTGHAIIVYDSNGEKIFQLENGGLLRSRHVKVDQNNWADYVFSEDYVLMPLTEVENYIKNNGRLPKMPSAEEVEKDGQDLGEMQNLQMEKIEELYLNMIELEKEVIELKQKVQTLETDNQILKNE